MEKELELKSQIFLSKGFFQGISHLDVFRLKYGLLWYGSTEL